MVLLDILILLILGYASYAGFRTGLIMQITTLVAIAAGIWGAIHFSNRMEIWFNHRIDLGTFAGPVSFLITFMLILVVTNLIGRMVTKGADLALLSLPNKIAGGVVSAAKYALILSALLQPLEGTGIFEMFIPAEEKEESILYEPIRRVAPKVIPALRDSPWIQRTWEKLKEEVEVSPE